MNTGQMIGLIGGIAGGIIGIVGGLIGTYFSIKKTNGPKERLFMIKISIIVWILVTVFLCLLLFLPAPYKWFMWIPYGIIMPLGIRYINKNQEKIKKIEVEQNQST
jgi:Ca2+/Na+ antiporter